MTISVVELRSYPQNGSPSDSELKRIRGQGYATAFLSHSHKDRSLAQRIQAFLQAQGWSVYIDWQDAEMPSTPNRETAEKLQAKIRDLAWFLFLATANSMASRWCPWELGYADAKKGLRRIAIIPTADDSGSPHGSEYLELYNRIDKTPRGETLLLEPDYSYNGVALNKLW